MVHFWRELCIRWGLQSLCIKGLTTRLLSKIWGFYSMDTHIQHVTKKLLLRLYYRNNSCFSFCVKRNLVESGFSSVINYGDVLYMNASACLLMLDNVHHRILTFIANCDAISRFCHRQFVTSRYNMDFVTLRKKCNKLKIDKKHKGFSTSPSLP